jgi:hypothetical protein
MLFSVVLLFFRRCQSDLSENSNLALCLANEARVQDRCLETVKRSKLDLGPHT